MLSQLIPVLIILNEWGGFLSKSNPSLRLWDSDACTWSLLMLFCKSVFGKQEGIGVSCLFQGWKPQVERSCVCSSEGNYQHKKTKGVQREGSTNPWGGHSAVRLEQSPRKCYPGYIAPPCSRAPRSGCAVGSDWDIEELPAGAHPVPSGCSQPSHRA